MLQWILINLRQRGAKISVTLATLLTVIFSCLFFIFSTPVLAQSVASPNSSLNQGVSIVKQPLGLPSADIRLIVSKIIRAALGLIGIILIVLLLYAGFLWMTAGGNEEQITTAKKILANAIIGLIIILSAYGIVLLVMRILGIGAGGGAGDGGAVGIAPIEQNFQGSGALGGIIKDHYPGRSQVDVPRNTKIVITFRQPIKPDSIAINSNQAKDPANTIFGDCLITGAVIDWKTDCDQLIMDNDHIMISAVTIQNNQPSYQPISGAAILASYENGKVYTIVLQPLDALGNAVEKITYVAHVGNKILIDDTKNNNPPLFNNQAENYYEWQFTCDTLLDTAAPQVVNVFPAPNSAEAKNSVIQINFSEAMDPTGVQGIFNPAGSSNYYYVNGNAIFLKSTTRSSIPLGNFRLTNGYRTLEFTSTKECGQNACGGKRYCLPVCDQPNASCQDDVYEMLLKAAQTYSKNSFNAMPFSGLMDLAGNALDGNKNGIVDPVSSTAVVFPDQQKPDNYFWNFIIENRIDAASPYLQQVSPGLNGQNISAQDEWSMLFSKRMQAEPLYDGITMNEPVYSKTSLCKVPRLSNSSTFITMEHCPFLDAARHYYYPGIDSRVVDVHYNCFYPGKGPLGFDQSSKRSYICDGTNPANCCNVTSTPSSQAFCCNGLTSIADQTACLANLRANSP